MLNYLFIDKVIDDKFATMIVELVTYNPNYKMFVLSNVEFV